MLRTELDIGWADDDGSDNADANVATWLASTGVDGVTASVLIPFGPGGGATVAEVVAPDEATMAQLLVAYVDDAAVATLDEDGKLVVRDADEWAYWWDGVSPVEDPLAEDHVLRF